MTEPVHPSLLTSVRKILGTTVQALHTRLDLALVELREQKIRAVELVVWLVAGIFFGFMTVVVFSVAIVLLFNPENRVYAAGALALLYLGLALVCLGTVRRRLREEPKPFAETVEQLRKDKEWLRTRH